MVKAISAGDALTGELAVQSEPFHKIHTHRECLLLLLQGGQGLTHWEILELSIVYKPWKPKNPMLKGYILDCAGFVHIVHIMAIVLGFSDSDFCLL